MGICLQFAYRQAAGKSVPAPCDPDTPSADWWWDHGCKNASAMAAVGITAVLAPPVCKTQSGSAITGDGYGKFDDYDIGSKNQMFSTPTRFGSRKLLQRFAAVLAANGMDLYLDTVLHQYAGGSDGSYLYLGADGRTKNGRFPKQKSYFCSGPTSAGWAEHDPVAGDPDFGFGDEACYINAKPPGELAALAIAASDWVTRSLGAEGYRLDDTKGLNAGFVRRFATSAAMAGKYAFGEFDDGNRDLVNAWIENSIFGNGVQGTCSAEDFPLHYVLEGMCNNTSNWDMRQLDHAGLAGINPTKALTFVENPDTDTDGFATVIWNKAQAYFAILTGEGYPCLYWKDWSDDPGCYGWGMQQHISNCCWIATHLARGSSITRFADYQAIVYERQGAPGLLCGINNDQWNGWRTLWVQTNFGPNVQLHDYTGHAGDVWTNADGWAEISIPPNANGLGTVAYSRAGMGEATIPRGRSITQTTFGAPDLDIGPLVEGQTTVINEIWCAANKPISLNLTLDDAPAGTAVTLVIAGPDNQTLWRSSDGTPCKTEQSGWHTVYGISNETVSYELAVTYTATKTI